MVIRLVFDLSFCALTFFASLRSSPLEFHSDASSIDHIRLRYSLLISSGANNFFAVRYYIYPPIDMPIKAIV